MPSSLYSSKEHIANLNRITFAPQELKKICRMALVVVCVIRPSQ
jgi:hypothetical protein